ncbi:MAG: hypothetical protein IBJ03_04970 [Gemmatimonadaceae bacterium]|nr:hypothetical protein [Gemmatimonadaceae bacterium]
MRIWGLAIGALFVLGCAHAAKQQERVRRAVDLADSLSAFPETELAAIITYSDSLGRRGPERKYAGMRGTQCVSLASQVDPTTAIAAAQRLIERNERVPFDSLDLWSLCATHNWQLAFGLSGEIPLTWLADHAATSLLSIHAAHRAKGLVRFDSALAATLARGDTTQARSALAQFALEMWVRAQARLERPLRGIHDQEHAVHDLAAGMPLRFAALPPIPATSDLLGESEAEWAARLFTTGAEWTKGPRRSWWYRLSLAPWVAMAKWDALDSAATHSLTRAPGDSALVMARPLAHWYTERARPAAAARIDSQFDHAAAQLPRVDSVRYDGFDNVLSADDDEWRYGFLPDTRRNIDRRGWVVLDPMWTTPTNEIRLAKRVRVAESDYLYANVTRVGQSGSETHAGRLHLRRGRPSMRWQFVEDRGGLLHFERLWDGVVQRIAIEDTREWWKAFSGGRQRAAQMGVWAIAKNTPDCEWHEIPITATACAERQRALWTGVRFVGRMDTVDVMLARFRAASDSVDMHVESRIPLRTFPHRDSPRVRRDSRIITTLFLRNELGGPIIEKTTEAALLPSNRIALTHQWDVRTGTGQVMHRVESWEASRDAAARGVMHFSSDAAIRIPVRGFGMSDVLITGNAVENRRPAQRWSDFTFTPNAGVVAQKERFSLLWEIYELTPGPDGRVRWRVDIRREAGEATTSADMRDALTTATKAGAKVEADEPDAASLNYTREAPARAVIVEHVKLPIPEKAPHGRHVVSIKVTDLVSGRSETRSTPVRVLLPSLQQRINTTPPAPLVAPSMGMPTGSRPVVRPPRPPVDENRLH